MTGSSEPVRNVVNRKTLRATLFNNGKRVFQAPIGVGKASTPTPAGDFWIREKLAGFGPVYGPLAFGTAAYSTKLTDWPGGGDRRNGGRPGVFAALTGCLIKS